MLRICAGLLTVLIGSAPVANTAVNSAGDPRMAFGPGEQSIYRIAYFGVSGGTAQVTVGADTQQWGKRVWPIVVIARSDPALSFYPIRDRFVSFWEFSAGRPIGSDLRADENHKKRYQRIKLDHEGKLASVLKQKEGEQPSEDSYPIEPGSLDMAAAAFALRTKPLQVGRSFDLPVFTGHKSFRLRAMVEGTERLKTPIGEREVYRVRVQTDFSGKFQSKRDMVGYFAIDESHVLVRVEADFLLGTLVAELTSYQPGRTTAPEPLRGSNP